MYSRRSNLVTRSTPYSSRASLWRSSCSSWRRGGNMCSTFGMCSTLLWSSFQSSPRCLCCFSASHGDDCMLPHCLQITRTFEIVQGRTDMYSSICFLKQKVRAFSLQMFGISLSRESPDLLFHHWFLHCHCLHLGLILVQNISISTSLRRHRCFMDS